MTKHLRLIHRIDLQECTVFDAVHSPSASSSAASLASTSAATTPPNVTCGMPFTLALKGKLTKEKTEEYHRSITTFKVKGLHPFSDAESPSFRYNRYNKSNWGSVGLTVKDMGY